ncbi:hypothetical protein U27_02151 [Candidatus Vecturithrix granuli]|uniref:Uncharacterized protein n=1 Tax=Vecturithrix granuli TaxID=1499967 RepID=A0A0S6W6Q9_VECG1|nr:hypothetical protein U27_02151 [Candidatus Vecturithrix granuli]
MPNVYFLSRIFRLRSKIFRQLDSGCSIIHLRVSFDEETSGVQKLCFRCQSRALTLQFPSSKFTLRGY